MNRNQFSTLRSSIAGLRRARRALKGGRPADALAEFSAARHNCGLATGLIYALGPCPPPPSAGRVWNAAARVEEEIAAEITRLHREANQAPATKGELIADVAAGIGVFLTRDGIEIPQEQVLERARNIVAGLQGNYRITEVSNPGFRTQVPVSAGVKTRVAGALVTGGQR